jgi:uncharacterized membrane protein
MSNTTHAILLGVFTLASCIWVGGYVAIAVVARVATRTLAPVNRVTFFRALGRSYLRLGVPALLVAFGTGAGLLNDHSWDAVMTATVGVAAALLAALIMGVAQAQHMSHLRAAALATPEDQPVSQRVQRGARAATLLRAGIGLLSIALIALGSLLAT